MPADTEDATGIGLVADGDVIVDRCRVLHNPRYGIVRPERVDPELFTFCGLSVSPYKEKSPQPTRVHFDQNLIEGSLAVRLDYPVPITIERCLLLGWRWAALKLFGNAGPVAVRHNVIHANGGPEFHGRQPHTSLLFANNLVSSDFASLLFWSGEKAAQRPALQRKLRIENNIFRSFHTEGINLMADEPGSLAADWRVGNNCYAAPPVAVRELAPFPVQPSDCVHPLPFASIDTSDPNYLLPAAGGPLASGGAGGDLPNYIGPLAPQPDAPENAWFAELNRDWKQEVGLRLKPDDVAAPPPLDEWLKGRKIRTVAQDGSAEFKTIGEALAALKPGEVVKVLDQGPYRESFNFTAPADTGLVSEAGTQVEFAPWQPFPASTAGKSNYFGATFFVADGFRLSGFRFAGPKLPEDTEWAQALALASVRGDVTVENCIVLHEHPRYTFTPGTHEVYPHLFRGLAINKHLVPRDAPTAICLRDNWIEGMLAFDVACRASILMERNVVIGWRNDCLYLPRQAVDVVVRHNVLVGWSGLALQERMGDPTGARPEARYAIVNNVVYCVGHAIAALWLPPGPLNDLAPPPKNVRIQNNLIWSVNSHGIHLNPLDLTAVSDAWRVGHNAYLNNPQAWGNSLPFPQQAGDLIVPKPFLSDDPNSVDFLRVSADSPLATGGAGGDLPAYIGALPPGQADEQDWFAKLRAKVSQ